MSVRPHQSHVPAGVPCDGDEIASRIDDLRLELSSIRDQIRPCDPVGRSRDALAAVADSLREFDARLAILSAECRHGGPDPTPGPPATIAMTPAELKAKLDGAKALGLRAGLGHRSEQVRKLKDQIKGYEVNLHDMRDTLAYALAEPDYYHKLRVEALASGSL